MSTVTGGQGNIVTNGLVLNLDAANPRSYPQPYNGTAWQNIAPVSSSLVGTLTNGPTFNSSNGGSIVFDGVDDNCVLGIVLNMGTNSLTINTWFKSDQKLHANNQTIVNHSFGNNSLNTRVLNKGYVQVYYGDYNSNSFLSSKKL